MKMIKICAQALNRWILTQKSTVKASDSRRNGMVATLLILSFGVATAFGLTPGTSLSPIPVSAVIEDITRDNLTPVETPGIYTQQDLARSGDTLASLLFRMGVDDRAALDFMRTNAIAKTIFQQMSPGKPIRVQKRANGDLISLRFPQSDSHTLVVERLGDQFQAASVAVGSLRRVVQASGTIESSLFAAADAAGLAMVFTGHRHFRH